MDEESSVYIHRGVLVSHKNMPFVGKKNQTVEIMLSQSSQSYKDKHCVFFLICIIWGRGRNENEVGALRRVVGETGRAGSREEKCDKPER